MTGPTLSLFTVPKAFEGTTAVQQCNAIQSWLRLGESVEVLLVGDDRGTAQTAAQLGVRHLAMVERSASGTPLVSSAFRLAQDATTSMLLCYVNADIMLLPDFVAVLDKVPYGPFLVCGRRWDVELDTPIDFSAAAWSVELRQLVNDHGKLHASTGIDYFLFPRGLYTQVPPFAIGRTMWDNWLVFHARARGAAVIDATETITAVHQNHDYRHVPGGIEGAWTGVEAIDNQRLASQMLVPFTIDDATHRLVSQALVPNRSMTYLGRVPQQLVALALRNHPRARETVRALARAAHLR